MGWPCGDDEEGEADGEVFPGLTGVRKFLLSIIHLERTGWSVFVDAGVERYPWGRQRFWAERGL